MGLATGLFWANRGFLALTATNDSNRNYYYGVENFVASLGRSCGSGFDWVVHQRDYTLWLAGRDSQSRIPHRCNGGLWPDGSLRRASSNGAHSEIQSTPHSFFSVFIGCGGGCSSWLCCKGLAQGYIVTAPAMLIMLLVGQEGTLGAYAGYRRCLHGVPHVYRLAGWQRPNIASSSSLPGSSCSSWAHHQYIALQRRGRAHLHRVSSAGQTSCWILPTIQSSFRWSTWSPISKDATSTPISSTTNSACLLGRGLGCCLFLGIAYWRIWRCRVEIRITCNCTAAVVIHPGCWPDLKGSDCGGH